MKRSKRPSVGFLNLVITKHAEYNDLSCPIITLLTEEVGIAGKNTRSVLPENVE
jgi:hypothetical protein